MEVDNYETNGDGKNENGFHPNSCPAGRDGKVLRLYPVNTFASGEGLPYAPVDWPNPGDKWRWKVGKRITSSGYFLDRYLYAPPSLQDGLRAKSFASKLSVEQFVKKKFRGVDVNAFFASFSWKIPSEASHEPQGNESLKWVTNHSEPDSAVESRTCKAGNKMCSSLTKEENLTLKVTSCDICCAEPAFCRDCCCILCSRTIDFSYGGYSFIRCEVAVAEGIICGHIAHVECGLRSYMAGTVGGSIGLDAEYYCRRCDARTELVSHVAELFESCKSVDSRDDIKKILNVGICILRGSQKTSAQRLSDCIELVKAQLQSGICLEDIWKTQDSAIDELFS